MTKVETRGIWGTVRAEFLGAVSLLLFFAGIGCAFWLVLTEGLHAWTLLAIAGAAAVSGAATSLDLVLTERRNRLKAGLPADAGSELQAYGPAQRLALLVLCYALESFGVMIAAPIITVSLFCGAFGSGFASRECVLDLGNARAWLLFAAGIAALLAGNWIYDEEKLGYKAVSRLRRKGKRKSKELTASETGRAPEPERARSDLTS